jgi:uncharacterized membrane protein YphA (DoxX/SURF4 family)
MFRRYTDLPVRVIVGGLFIFSGLIKLNDPVGTTLKLEEYFHVFSEDFGSFFSWFIPSAQGIGLVLVVLEIALGVAVLLYYKMRVTAPVLLALIVFFTFLTFYSAYFNKVTDCGCFGDAIKLTPWESFFKDIVLLVLVLHLFWYRKAYTSPVGETIGHGVVAGVTLLSFFTGIYAINHLPFVDFRPYKIGNHIPTQMQPAEVAQVEYVFEKDGKEVRSEKFLPDSEGYKYVSSRVLNEEESKPKITDYNAMLPSGEDITQYTFEGVKLLFIFQNVNLSSVENMDAIVSLVSELQGKVEMLALTSSGEAEFDAFRHEHQLAIPFAFTDATVLKTIVRSNPGITLWVNGTVRGLWHHNDTPDAREVLDRVTAN